MKRASRKTPIPLLMPIAVILLASATIRVGLEAGAAFAANRPTIGRASDALVCAPTPIEISNRLDERERLVADQEAALDARKMKLDQAEIMLDLRMKELKAEQEKLNRMTAYADEAAEKDISKLTDIYQAMRPKDASTLFNGMDPEFAAGFLGRMRPAEAAAILAGMEPNRAYALSAMLAGRNAEVAR